MPSEATRRILTLSPGAFAFGDQEVVMRTLLGSCVAVTFWHPRIKFGAMCHYLLPNRSSSDPGDPGGRYGEEVLHAIAGRFRNAGLEPEAFEVRMFGGANMFPGLTGSAASIGERNIEVGRAVVSQLGFRLGQEDLGGVLHRRVIFEIASGHVDVQYGEGPTGDRGGRR